MRFDKQKIIRILPFPFLGYFFNKVSEAFTSAAGTTTGEKIIDGMNSIGRVFLNPLPSFKPTNLLIGAAGAVLVKVIIVVEKGIIAALNAKNYIVPAEANLDCIIERLKREDKHFFETRDKMQNELSYLTPNITSIEQLINELIQTSNDKDAPVDLLGDVQRVLHKDNVLHLLLVQEAKRKIVQMRLKISASK